TNPAFSCKTAAASSTVRPVIAGTNPTAGVGVFLAGGASTVTNAGTISGIGGTAISFGSANDLLVVESGAVFSGIVDGGAGGNTLELAASATPGTLFDLGTSVVNFGSVTVDAGGTWLLSGTNTLGAATTLDDFGTLEVATALANSG